jgi:hypothetical protein
MGPEKRAILMSSHFVKTATKLGQVLYTRTNVSGLNEMALTTHISKPSKYHLNRTTAIPCEIRGVVYPSITAAARAVGVTPATITQTLNRKGNLETVGLGKKNPGPAGQTNAAKPITLWGIKFASRTDAAKKLGICRVKFTRSISKAASKTEKETLMMFVMNYLNKCDKEKTSAQLEWERTP